MSHRHPQTAAALKALKSRRSRSRAATALAVSRRPVAVVGPEGNFPALDNLTPLADFGSGTVTPTIHVDARDAVAAGDGSWPARYGEDYALEGTGTDPILDTGCPTFGDGDTSIKYTGAGGNTHRAQTTGFADLDLTTDDVVVECVLSDLNSHVYGKRDGASGAGWGLYLSGGITLTAYAFDGTNVVTAGLNVTSAPFYHVVMCIKAGGSCTLWVNANKGTVGNAATVGDCSNAGWFEIGSIGRTPANLSAARMARLTAWIGAGIIPSHEIDAWVHNRFADLTGQVATNTPVGKVRARLLASRSDDTVIEKRNASGEIEFYRVGFDWPAMTQRADSIGYRTPEAVSAYTRENLPYSSSIYWGATRASLSDKSQEGPFRNVADVSAVALVPNTDTLSHSLYIVNTSWTAVEQVALLIKPVNNTWISVNLFWSGTSHFAYIDIANDTAGMTVDAAFSSITVEDGYVDDYKLVLIKLAAPLTSSVQSIIYAATGDGTVDTSAGDNVTEAFRLAYFNASNESTWIRPTITAALARTTGAESEPAFRDPTASYLSEPNDLSKWTQSDCTGEYGYRDPEGGWTASALIGDATTSLLHQCSLARNDIAVAGVDTAQKVTLTGWTRAGDKEHLRVIHDQSLDGYFDFELAGSGSSVVGRGVEAEITAEENGWYRWRAVDEIRSFGALTMIIRAQLASPATSWAGDGVTPSLYFHRLEIYDGNLSFGEIDRRRNNRMLPADARVDVDLDYVDAGATAQVPFSIGDGTANNRIEPDLAGNVATGFAVANAVTEFDSTAENLLPYPIYFDGWSKTKCTITTGQDDPFGGSLGSLFTADGTTGQKAISTGSTSSATTVTCGIYAKLVTGDGIMFFQADAIGGSYQYFDLANGTLSASVGVDSASITDAGNGWYRLVYTGTFSGPSATTRIGTDINGNEFLFYGATLYAGDADLGFDRAQVTADERQVLSFEHATNAFSARSQYGELTDTLGDVPDDLDRRWLYLNQRGGQGLVDSTLYSLKIYEKNNKRELETYAYFDPDVTKPGVSNCSQSLDFGSGAVTPELYATPDGSGGWTDTRGNTIEYNFAGVLATDAPGYGYDGGRASRYVDGIGQAVHAVPTLAEPGSDPIIIRAVVKAKLAANDTICGWLVSSPAFRYLVVQTTTAGYAVQTQGTSAFSGLAVLADADAWVDVWAVVVPGVGSRIYLNGTASSQAADPGLVDAGATFAIGGRSSSTSNNLDGDIALCAVWRAPGLATTDISTTVKREYAKLSGQRLAEAQGVSEATTLASRAGHAYMRVRPLDAAGHPTGETLWAPQEKDGPSFEQNEKGRVVYQPGKAEEQRLAYSDGFGSSWAIRGSVSVADAVAGDGVVRQCEISGLGVSGNDIYIVTTGFGADGAIGVGFSVNVPAGVMGTWQVVNNYGPSTLGQWDIDMSLLAGKGEQWVTRDHPAVSVVSAFVANGAGNCIFLIRAVATTLPTFTMSLITMIPSTLDPVRPILTSGSTRTTAAETPMRWSDAANVPAGNELRLTSDVVWPYSVANERWASITDGTSANRIDCYVLGGSGRPLRAFISNGSVNVEGPAASAGPELKRIEVITATGAMRTKINDVAGPVGITPPPTGVMTEIMPSAAAFAGGPIGYGFEIQSIRVEAL